MTRTVRPRPSRRGSQLVEAGLMMMPFLALGFMTLDSAWAVFVRVTLQHAVREGVRYGVTGQTSGNNGQVASIKAVAVSQAMGLLSGSQADALSVTFLNPSSLTATTSNNGGNIVQVSVTSYQIPPLAPLLRSATPLTVSVTAADVIEGSPDGIPPAP